MFVKSGQYVNLAWADPKDLYVEEHPIKNLDGKKLSVGIMTGTVTESFLFTPVKEVWTTIRGFCIESLSHLSPKI
jgi:hypothetical protein